MKILTNHPHPELLEGLALLLVQALAVDAGEVWLLSPWLADVRLPLARAGRYAGVLGGQRDEMGLSDLLALVASRHALHVVTRPPGELVDCSALRRLAGKLEARRAVVEDPDLHGLSIVDELALEYDRDAAALATVATTHAETLRLGLALRQKGARLYYLERLHAKVLWTPVGCLVGSANFTRGGLIHNEELTLEVTDPAVHAALLAPIQRMAGRACPTESYSLTAVLRQAEYPVSEFRGFATGPGAGPYPDLRLLLDMLLPFVR